MTKPSTSPQGPEKTKRGGAGRGQGRKAISADGEWAKVYSIKLSPSLHNACRAAGSELVRQILEQHLPKI